MEKTLFLGILLERLGKFLWSDRNFIGKTIGMTLSVYSDSSRKFKHSNPYSVKKIYTVRLPISTDELRTPYSGDAITFYTEKFLGLTL